jgi:hypothetical protein
LRRTCRGAALGAVLLLLGVPAAASAAPGAAASASLSLSYEFRAPVQARILAARGFALRVRSSGQGSVAATVRLRRLTGTGAGAARLIARSTTRLAASGRRTLRIPLTATGAAALRGCGGARIEFAVAVRAAAARRDSAASRRTSLLTTNAGPCRAAAARDIPEPGAGRCDPIDPSRCLLPWPNDRFTRRDTTAATGRRLNLSGAATPVNAGGVRVAVEAYNRSDGFSPGQAIVTRIPGLDSRAALRRTGAVPVNDIARSFDRDAPIVVLNARTGQRQPIWAEVDANASTPQETALLIRPARNFAEFGRYIVVLRRLRDSAGRRLAPSRAFRAYRDRLITSRSDLEGRRAHMEGIFATLAKAGIARSDLNLAWDFTVSSRQNLAERMLSLRDRAFAELGDTNLADLRVAGRAPGFTVDTVQDFTAAENPDTVRRVSGKVTVPCYLDQPGCPPGARFAFAPGGRRPLRIAGNTIAASYVCNIPRSAVAPGAAPARAVLYGHGLLGSRAEVTARQFQALGNRGNLVLCATDWIGMSAGDVGNVAAILQDLSRFPSLADRLQQGLLDFLYLGRAMIHPQGFGANAAFQGPSGRSVLGPELYLNGNSEGGILGGALSAVAPDFTRAILGVPGMNYSTLLQRSSDFGEFGGLLSGAYRSALDRSLLLSLIQTLWDRGEANGYAQHLTRAPYANTPRHTVLLLMGFGDHQVANVATEVQARTIGAAVRRPALDPGRSADRRPFYAIPGITRLPFGGSALVVYDIGPLRRLAGQTLGTPPPPLTNTPPTLGQDPHPAAGDEAWVQALGDAFFRPGGQVVNACGPAPCYADGWDGP